jgi:hypothetical protein
LILSDADALCEVCGRFIETRQVRSPSEQRQIKIVFDKCSECKAKFPYTYDDMAITYAMARYLMEHNIPERGDLGRYLEFQLYMLNHICEEHKSESIGEILDAHNSDLRQLEELTGYANEVIERHRKARSIITEVVEMVPTSNNQSLLFKEFMRKKASQQLSQKSLRKE